MIAQRLVGCKLSRPCASGLIVGLFGTNSTSIFTGTLALLRGRNVKGGLACRMELFASGGVLRSKRTLGRLLSPRTSIITARTRVFTRTSSGELFPGLEFSLGEVDSFVGGRGGCRTRVSFLMGPFTIRARLIHPSRLGHSFRLGKAVYEGLIETDRRNGSFI